MTIAAIRYNNPGDVSLPIEGWHGGGEIVGVRGQPGYARFPTMAIGFEAFKQRLRTYIERGWNTINRMGPHYATDPKWAAGVARFSGLHPDHVINGSADLTALACGIIRQETGKTLAQLGLNLGEGAFA